MGAHIVFITRERVGEREERQLKKGRTIIEEWANTDGTDTTDFGGLLKRFEMFLGCIWDVLGIFGGCLGILSGVGSPPTALLAWVKKRTRIALM